jgi:cytoskeletal protein CcmA (bactofilin family)
MSRRLTPLGWVPLAALILVSVAPAHALTTAGDDLYMLPDDETRTGDHYVGAKKVNVLGTLEGDLVAVGETVEIHGTVTGDVFAAGSILMVSGNIGDSTRLAGSQITVSGTIEGDLLIAASVISISPGARVSGDVVLFGGQINVDGEIEGTLRTNGAEVLFSGSAGKDFLGTAGQISLLGTVGRNVKLRADTLKMGPSARVDGDLEYTAREPVEGLEGMGVVVGTIEYHKQEEKEPKEDEDEGMTLGWVFRRFLLFLAALLTGFVLLRLFPTQAARAGATVGRDPLPSFGVGFVLAIVLPVAVVIVCLFVITIPLAFITFLLYVIGIYLAKYPVALWIGRSTLQLAGMAEPSPYLSLTIGLVPLLVLFQLPYLGWFAWFVTIFLGMGSIFLAIQSRGGAAGASGPRAAPASGGDPA